MEMFDEVKTVSVRTVNGKRYISDDETLAEMQFQEVCEELVEAEREFAEWDAKAGKRWAHPDSDPANLCQWFDSLERRYRADKRLWELSSEPTAPYGATACTTRSAACCCAAGSSAPTRERNSETL